MKKIALTSLLAVFAVSGANAATNYFVGGAAGLSLGNEHKTILAVAPELGWKLNADWDLGVAAHFGYEHKDDYKIKGVVTPGKSYDYGAGVFARYKVAQFGGVKLLLKGSAGVDLLTFSPETDTVSTETATMLSADVIPMITYDISEAFTLYANLNFLGAHAGYTFKNDNMDIAKGWAVSAYTDTANVANTADFQIGFNYNF